MTKIPVIYCFRLWFQIQKTNKATRRPINQATHIRLGFTPNNDFPKMRKSRTPTIIAAIYTMPGKSDLSRFIIYLTPHIPHLILANPGNIG